MTTVTTVIYEFIIAATQQLLYPYSTSFAFSAVLLFPLLFHGYD